MKTNRIKITVFKRVDPAVIFDGNVPTNPEGKKYEICHFVEGTEWIVEKNMIMPEGFCSWAWRDLIKDIRVLAHGGSYYPWVEEGVAFTACTDGIRPVSFKLEVLHE